jgi:hypothetical protein
MISNFRGMSCAASAYSGPKKPPLPIQISHLFRLNVATRSDSNWRHDSIRAGQPSGCRLHKLDRLPAAAMCPELKFAVLGCRSTPQRLRSLAALGRTRVAGHTAVTDLPPCRAIPTSGLGCAAVIQAGSSRKLNRPRPYFRCLNRRVGTIDPNGYGAGSKADGRRSRLIRTGLSPAPPESRVIHPNGQPVVESASWIDLSCRQR